MEIGPNLQLHGKDPYEKKQLLYICAMHLTLTLYGHINIAEQRTNIQQYGDWYTGR